MTSGDPENAPGATTTNASSERAEPSRGIAANVAVSSYRPECDANRSPFRRGDPKKRDCDASCDGADGANASSVPTTTGANASIRRGDGAANSRASSPGSTKRRARPRPRTPTIDSRVGATETRRGRNALICDDRAEARTTALVVDRAEARTTALVVDRAAARRAVFRRRDARNERADRANARDSRPNPFVAPKRDLASDAVRPTARAPNRAADANAPGRDADSPTLNASGARGNPADPRRSRSGGVSAAFASDDHGVSSRARESAPPDGPPNSTCILVLLPF